MRRKLLTIAYSAAFLLLLGAKAQAQYVRPPSDPPTDSDLLAYDGLEKTVIVEIINSTPYDIYLKDTHLLPAPSSTPPPPLTSTTVTTAQQTEMLNKDRHDTKSFMFAPTGIPWYMPGAPIEAFKNPDKNYRNTFTKPFTMAISWDDHGGFNSDNWVKWTVKQVEYCTAGYSDADNQWHCTDSRHGDVDLGLWLYRIQKQPDKVDSVFFPTFIKDFLNEALALAGLVADPANILGWISMAQATKELALGPTEFMKSNSLPDDGNTLYLASYVVPADSSFCSQVSHTGMADCSPALMALRRNTCTSTGCTVTDKTGDAVASKWGADAAGACDWSGGCPTIGQGPAFAPEAELVVTVHLLRSQPATTAGQSGVLDHVSIYADSMQTTSPGPVPLVTATIQTVSNGLPSGTVIGSGAIPITDLPAGSSWQRNPQWVTFKLSSVGGASLAMTPGTQYAIVVSAGGGIITWYGSGDVYAGGSMVFPYTSGWGTVPSADFLFQTYIMPNTYNHYMGWALDFSDQPSDSVPTPEQ
ncbi:MAG TPA: hypothetical protein VGS10_22170 [Terracidiphilus sp.]|nr:hypothetical protein [Terracidiphilus sp.]